MANSIYKVGEKVIVGKRIGSQSDYPCQFIQEMAKLEGKVLTIIGIHKYFFPDYKYKFEDYYYTVAENNYNWSAAMFKGTIERFSQPLLSIF